MTKKELMEQLAEFSDDKEVLVWGEDMGLVELDFVAENVSEDEKNGAAIIYIKNTEWTWIEALKQLTENK